MERLLFLFLFLFIFPLSYEALAQDYFLPLSQPSTEINAPNYYDQLLFGVSGSCSNIHTMWFMAAYSWERESLGNDSQGRPAFAEIVLQLFSDGTYWAQYEEIALVSQTP